MTVLKDKKAFLKCVDVLCALLMLLPFSACNKKENLPPQFVELPAEHTNINFQNTIEDTPEHNILIYSNYYGGGGVGVGDFNQDGWQDLFFAGNLVRDALYFNQGGMKFAQQTEAGILADDGWSSGVIVADVNHDGWPDIYVTRELYDDRPARRANLFYLNKGDGSFAEVGQICGVADEGRSRSAIFFDYDRDGDLDLYVLNQPPNPGNYSPLLGTDLTKPAFRSKLYRNDGNNPAGQPIFTDTGETSGIAEVGFPNAAISADFNGDGWPDLYVSHDYDAPDRLYQNNGDGTFTDVIQKATGHTSFYGMGVDAADINQDGLLDLMVLDMVAEDNYRLKANMSGMNPEAFTNVVKAGGHYQYMFNTLQLNRGQGQFSEVAQLTGMAATDWSWANLFADFNNDGRQDVFITNGLLRDIRNTDAAKRFATYVTQQVNAYIKANPDDAEVTIYDVIDLQEALDLIPSQPLSNYVYENEGVFNFSPRGKAWGLDRPGFSNGAAYADLNNDGRLDLVVSNINAPASIYENRQTTGNYLRIKLKDPQHKTTFGARIMVAAGGKQQHFTWSTVHGMYSTSEDVLHVGLGEAAGAEQVTVLWPDGHYEELRDVAANQLVTFDKSGFARNTFEQQGAPWLRDVTTAVDLPYQHRENIFDDYRYQVLLPHKQSENGPGVAVADLNGDQLDDLYLGGASGQPGELYLQTSSGSFIPSSAETFRGTSLLEDVAATCFDADGDGDQDLYVVSGGNEFPAGSPFYQDRLYLNDGKGAFTLASDGTLPPMPTSGGCVAPADFDGDGDLDLFVGGRLKPHDYPAPAASYLLRNDGGKFTDVTASMAPFLQEFGMVTAATWTDLNGDGLQDVLLVGEWMPLTVLYQTDNEFRLATDFTDAPASTTGWWFSLTKGDLDGDGDEDFIFGNLGENYKYQASTEEPFEVFYSDFDGNGQRDIVLSYYNGGEQFPLRGRSCSAQQIPELKEAFPSYDAFAGATLTDVFDPAALEQSLQLSATTFQSVIAINEGGRLMLKALPPEAQLSPIRAGLINDVNQDGIADAILVGNLYQSEVETPRADASLGVVLQGKGKGRLAPLSIDVSGLAIRKDLREICTVKTVGGTMYLLVSNNGKVNCLKQR